MSTMWTPNLRPRIGIVACGAVVRELTAIANRQGWNFALTAVPAQLHNRPARIAPAVDKTVAEWAGRFDLILVGYADCGTGGALDAVVKAYPHVLRIDGPHCYEFFGGAAFDALSEAEPGTFFLTDFLARHFDGLVWRGLGLDRFPELLIDYFANYRSVVYLRQTEHPKEAAELEAAAVRAAARLKLPLTVVPTGLASLEARVVAQVQDRMFALAAHTTQNIGEPAIVARTAGDRTEAGA